LRSTCRDQTEQVARPDEKKREQVRQVAIASCPIDFRAISSRMYLMKTSKIAPPARYGAARSGGGVPGDDEKDDASDPHHHDMPGDRRS
jgi:hypothetical protein